VRSIGELEECLAQGEVPKFIMFWGHRANQDTTVRKSWFSQWYEADFVVNGCRYPTAEHYMMAEKARLFGDAAAEKRVLVATTPGAVKAIGREITGFDGRRSRCRLRRQDHGRPEERHSGGARYLRHNQTE
jgi:predicted NAD-dependent protein-ADP-ribosyltransferase YbiA (DUF1768 family)